MKNAEYIIKKELEDATAQCGYWRNQYSKHRSTANLGMWKEAEQRLTHARMAKQELGKTNVPIANCVEEQ